LSPRCTSRIRPSKQKKKGFTKKGRGGAYWSMGTYYVEYSMFNI